MWRLAVSLFIVASICIVARADDGPQRFVVSLPDHWQEATRLRLVLEGVRTPGNVPLKLRVTATADDGREVVLGSVGVVAIGPTRTETRYLRSLRLDATRSLKRLLENRANPIGVELEVQVVDARNNPIRNLKWSIEKVRLETQQKQAEENITNPAPGLAWSIRSATDVNK